MSVEFERAPVIPQPVPVGKITRITSPGLSGVSVRFQGNHTDIYPAIVQVGPLSRGSATPAIRQRGSDMYNERELREFAELLVTAANAIADENVTAG